ncbi:MAG: hypothetical protein ACI4F7_03930 [Acutalibacteraceae bacterium]
MNTYDFDGNDFKCVFETEAWKIGLLRFSDRFSKPCMFERHLKTPEIFVLLNGSAVLYERKSDGTVISAEMEFGKVYKIETGKWHHITVSEDATVLVVENSDTSKENTEKSFVL